MSILKQFKIKGNTMNYLKNLYEVTAMLLLYSNQMIDEDYPTVISRYIVTVQSC